jgi:predicted Zn-dependent peptidase
VELERLDDGLTRCVAPNGLVTLVEELPAVRSAAVGIWVRSASAHETPAQMGAAHLLEHLLFKGTERRTAKQLALELEVRGGSLDAYTSRDHTCLQAHVLDADVPLAVEILTDLVRRPLLRAEDLELERNVVLEEINGVLDTPDDLVFDVHARTLWPEHPYGYAILGTPETVGRLTRDDLAGIHAAGYYPGNCVVAAAGHLEPARLLEQLDREGWFAGPAVAPRAPVASAPARRGVERPEPRDSAQTHIVLGTDTCPGRDPRRYPLALLVNVIGGGMSSRLFQRVREELGLAYSVYAFQHFYQASGLAGVYVGTQPGSAEPAEAAIREELARVAQSGLTASELADAKQQLKGQIMLSLESPQSRMHRLAGMVLHHDRYRRLDEILADIDAITDATLAAVAAEFFDPARWSVVRLGALNGGER